MITDAFQGLSAVKQHQLVYGALGDSIKSAIHALSIQTFTKEEWRKQRAFEIR
ncbi:MAG: BolA/IbaG family iron-sulfur metabolism protein [Gammaproteobacteria bacterium]